MALSVTVLPPLQHDHSIKFQVIPLSAITDSTILECSTLFSTEYGVWSSAANPKLAGKPVKLSPKMWRSAVMFDSQCYIVTARVEEDLAGFATCRRFNVAELKCTVLTILVEGQSATAGERGKLKHYTPVPIPPNCQAPPFGGRGIASAILKNTYTAKTDLALGIVSSNAFAIRALEAASDRRVTVPLINKWCNILLRSSGVPYLAERALKEGHEEMLKIVRAQKNWILGDLGDGEEFVGIVFLRGSVAGSGSETGSPRRNEIDGGG
ncbi:hypothetical protein BDK51DRAFT_34525 [Blyttiomyces helicus]|uniref:N-acetyltransferase domain-containing protein n=1 Tax=Blyttiomyces helicus TaxID=388810 RepID=A0A4P9WQA5_9FUNG|nr:hypothetical protein BDK51DRAFT_34525 [Blyttiomyces helicus]|eukprot:RKO94772.1 hypothetical protein BDK51DRAFT_34525 [Blyttiomyces helicus]